MGLKETIQNVVPVAFTAIDNLAEEGTYVRLQESQQTYSPTTGAVEELYLRHDNVKFLMSEYSSRDIDGEVILTTDRRVLIPKTELTVQPKAGDMIERSTDEHWRVVNPKIDPADALWDLQVRLKDDAP